MKKEHDVSRRNFLRAASVAAASSPFVLHGAQGAAADDEVFNIAMLSTAHIHTQSFMINLAQQQDRRAISVWDDNEERGQRYANQFDSQFEADLDAVVENPDVDGFVICSETARHLQLLEKTLPTGKPVFCEKPLVTNTQDLDVVEELLEEYGTTLFAGYFLPFSGRMQAAKELVDEGAFGDITRVRYREAHPAAYEGWFDDPDLAWFTDPELAGGGGFLDLGTHAIHLMLSFFGSAEEIVASIRNESGNYTEVDDFGVAQMKLDNGILATVEAGWTQTAGISGLEITGSERTLWFDGSRYYHDGPGHSEEVLEGIDSVPDRVDRLIAVLKDEIPQEELDADLEASMEAVRVMEAAYNSSESGQWESVT
ncbi:MAG: Gfo/Idh/MocA family protein [Candidatus Hydrogenedentota bacterium]